MSSKIRTVRVVAHIVTFRATAPNETKKSTEPTSSVLLDEGIDPELLEVYLDREERGGMPLNLDEERKFRFTGLAPGPATLVVKRDGSSHE